MYPSEYSPTPAPQTGKPPEDSSPATKWTTLKPSRPSMRLPEAFRGFSVSLACPAPCGICPSVLRCGAVLHITYYITVALGFSTGNSLDQRVHVLYCSHEDQLRLAQCRDDQMTGGAVA
ncbi:uncharacterized protein ASPGLDRAFT_41043 [Aspergillus glaucus CBS 516.65]|uniref:Uncharacterized protein n=1 Tax=Aspergillus glaucus CBS 516.65 TaxID=1160497 RepID=A0A1L9VYV8_ASPGL|nr:hypothetical protein ASPGLDRAFT_41043 [Aspergillus glaucus CBS 516.65]OJJ89104.1 hypothetical protein ASPGLDRAFT_41043 [Aspergillus glaucus CBS 516.65]